jgi:anti-sigma B factor antagonist
VSAQYDAETPLPQLDVRYVDSNVDGALVVAVTGEIDHETAPVLEQALPAALDQARGPCVLDLTSVRFLGAVGLATLVNATNQAEARGTPLRIVVDGNRPVIRPIQVMDLDDELRLYHTVEDALQAANLQRRP